MVYLVAEQTSEISGSRSALLRVSNIVQKVLWKRPYLDFYGSHYGYSSLVIIVRYYDALLWVTIVSNSTTQRTQYPLIKEYTLNLRTLQFKAYSLIKGYWVLWGEV